MANTFASTAVPVALQFTVTKWYSPFLPPSLLSSIGTKMSPVSLRAYCQQALPVHIQPVDRAIMFNIK
jgi:hypothetical protein